MDFQEGKFMFENWNKGYAVLFSERIRKNGILGQSPTGRAMPCRKEGIKEKLWGYAPGSAFGLECTGRA